VLAHLPENWRESQKVQAQHRYSFAERLEKTIENCNKTATHG